MNVDHFDIRKTGMLFFDLLNSFIHGSDADAQARKMPMVKRDCVGSHQERLPWGGELDSTG